MGRSMALTQRPFAELTEDDLGELVAAGVTEGTAIEYKSAMYGSSDSDAKEFLKDLSSFANTIGGDLVIGVTESSGIATELSGVVSDPDKALQRLQSLGRDGLEPRIVGLRMRAIPLSQGGGVIVARVPRSWDPPHRVIARGSNRIYVRNSAGAYEPSIAELKVLFAQGASGVEAARAFRAERTARIAAGDTPIELAPDPSRLVVHLFPFAARSGGSVFDLERAIENDRAFAPMGAAGHTVTPNVDGFLVFRGGDQCHGYTQLYRDGRVESVKVGVVRTTEGDRLIQPTPLERNVVVAVRSFWAGLGSLGVPPPAVMLITMQGVAGAKLALPAEQYDRATRLPIRRDQLELPEVILEQYGAQIDVDEAIRPALNALWNTAGLLWSPNYSESGEWKGPGLGR